MLEIMFDVTRNIVVLLIVFSLLELFLPRGEFRPFLNMVIGLVLMLTLLGPLWALRQLPGEPPLPATERQGLTDDENARLLSRLEQLNQGLTLQRYRALLTEKIGKLLLAEGLKPLEHTLELVEKPGHPAYGQLLSVRVLAVAAEADEPPLGRMPEIRVKLEGGKPSGSREYAGEAWTAGVPSRGLASLLARNLGLPEEKIEVRVLKN
jgi:stage III sporulation protein AF